MYLLIKVNDVAILEKVRGFLGLLGLWFNEFNDLEYRVDVSAEERSEILYSRGHHGSLNPYRAWETCNFFVQAWDFDNLGRIWPKNEEELKRAVDDAPEGKGWIVENGKKKRVAGECGNPLMLNDISCSKWCPKYEPMNIPAAIFVTEKVLQEHERRALVLRSHVEYLKTTDLQYREAIKIGGVFEYKNGKFIIAPP